MTQQIGFTRGAPVMRAIATAAMPGTTAPAVLTGLKTAIGVNAAPALLGVLAARWP